jgi:hypothetical protein
MRTILSAVAAVILAAVPVVAADSGSVIEEAMQSTQTRKLEAVARVIVLEGDRKASFDGLFTQYQDALWALNEQYAGLGWRLLEQSKSPGIEETKRILREFRDLEVKKLDLKEQYFEKFGEILEPGQFIRLSQLENKADAILKHTVALQIPFLE